jgi:DNA-directed RNA polymerase specialized sigma24 family protein
MSDEVLASAIITAQRGTETERKQAVEHIVATHWKALYKYLRFRHNTQTDDAQAVLQKFLTQLHKQEFLKRFDPAAAPFRHFLRRELDRYVGHSGLITAPAPGFPINFAEAEEEYRAEVRAPGLAADAYFESEWVRNLMTLALEELHNTLAAEGSEIHFTLFLQHDLQEKPAHDRISLDQLAAEMGIPLNDAMNALAAARQRFNHILTELVESLTTTRTELKREMHKIFGDSSLSS